MDELTHQLSQLQNNNFDFNKISSKVSVSNIYEERNTCFLNEFQLYLVLFNQIPNFSHIVRIDCIKANKWFVENHKSEIKDVFYDRIYRKQLKKVDFDDLFYVMGDDLLVDFDTNQNTVRFLYRKTPVSIIEKIENELSKFRFRKDPFKPQISIVVQSKFGLSTNEMEITKPKLKLEDNYNDDFEAIHQTIFKRLSQKNDKGLVLLHGKPGTGKTSYIRYLIASLK